MVWVRWVISLGVSFPQADIGGGDAQNTGKHPLWPLHDKIEHSLWRLGARVAMAVAVIVYNNHRAGIDRSYNALMARQLFLEMSLGHIACAQGLLLWWGL